jgi:phosphoglycolate phosphatase-like HAD superfamily hydrolase
MRFTVIVFDFDGTLVDSNLVKRLAYDKVFADCPACLRALPATLDALKLKSRHEIVRQLVSCMDDLSVEERQLEAVRRTEAYSAFVTDEIYHRALQSPATTLLAEWHHGASLYVCSLTPTDALIHLLRCVGWLPHFSGVEGYPVTKSEMLRRTAQRHSLRPEDILMVGDADADKAAAEDAGAMFFRIAAISDLFDLDRYLTA